MGYNNRDCFLSDIRGVMRALIIKKLPTKVNQNWSAGIKISSLEAQNRKLVQLLEPKCLVNTFTQVVSISLNIWGGNRPQNTTNGASGDSAKPYLEKPRSPQLAPGIDGSMNPELSCWYCKDTGHLKENCVKLNRRLAQKNRQPGKNNVDWLPKQPEN